MAKIDIGFTIHPNQGEGQTRGRGMLGEGQTRGRGRPGGGAWRGQTKGRGRLGAD